MCTSLISCEKIELMVKRSKEACCVTCGRKLKISHGLIHGNSTMVGYTCCEKEDFPEGTWQREVLEGWWK